MDLDHCDCLGKTCVIAEYHRTDLYICSYSRKEKTLSYSLINSYLASSNLSEEPAMRSAVSVDHG